MRNQNYWRLGMAVVLLVSSLVVSDQALGQDESVDQLRAKAFQAYQGQQWAEAIDAFKQVVRLDPDNGRDWHMLGYCQHLDGDLDAAIRSHTKATEFADFKPISLYNLGCAYSLKKDSDKAFEFLNKAFESGFDDVDLLDTDSDLKHVRNDPRFKKLVAFANGEEEEQEESKAESKDFDTSELVGEWKMIAGQRGGDDVDQSRMPPAVKFGEKELELPSPTGGDPFIMSFKIDASIKPMQIDLKIESGPVPDGAAKGILEFDGDKMKICYDGLTGSRPEKFETTEENGYFMFVMKKKSNPLQDFVGKWNLVSGTRAGEEVGKERLGPQITIDKETVTIPAGEDEFVMSYKIDTSKSPMTIDMKIESGPAPAGAAAVGIVEIKKDAVQICYDSTGANRPEEFKSTEEDGFFHFKMKRSKDK